MSNVKDRTFRQTQLQITNTNIPNLDMVVGNGAECVSGSAPFLCHLVHVSRPSIAFQGLILFAGTPGIRIGDLSHRIYLAKCYFGTPSNRTKHARLHSNFSYLNSQGSYSYLWNYHKLINTCKQLHQVSSSSQLPFISAITLPQKVS